MLARSSPSCGHAARRGASGSRGCSSRSAPPSAPSSQCWRSSSRRYISRRNVSATYLGDISRRCLAGDPVPRRAILTDRLHTRPLCPRPRPRLARPLLILRSERAIGRPREGLAPGQMMKGFAIIAPNVALGVQGCACPRGTMRRGALGAVYHVRRVTCIAGGASMAHDAKYRNPV